MKVIINKRIYTGEDVIENGFIRFGESIAQVDDMNRYVPADGDEVQDVDGDYIVPGFIDVHSHGGYGFDCMDASADEIDRMVRLMTVREGITTYFCTTMTQTTEHIESALVRIKEAAKKNTVIRGIHLEGPFISEAYKGAQDASFIKKPDEKLLERWNDLSGRLIRLVTYAPEEALPAFESWCRHNGLTLSAGHTNATYGCLCQSGATHVTHLYNAQRGLNHREPGVTGFGMLTDGVYTELICDGVHSHPKMVYMAHRMKGSRQIELVTDSMRAKGMPEGKSELGGQTVYVKDGTARLADGTIAGSVLTYIRAFQSIMDFAKADIADAVLMSSVNQAREFGLTSKGSLLRGKDADMVVLSRDHAIEAVYSMGNRAVEP